MGGKILKVLFILTETLRRSKRKDREYPLATQEDIPLGVSYISSVLVANGHQTDVFVTTTPDKLEDLDSYLMQKKPDIVGFSVVYREYYSVIKVTDHIKKKYPEIFVFAGGAHVTLNPDKIIAQNIDAVCIGEGEYPVLELANQLQEKRKPSGIRNFWFKTENGIEKNPVREYITDLDRLPFPNRKMWQKYVKNKSGIHDVLVGRGCPFNCTYCCNHALRRVAPGAYVRFRSPENIIAEIQQLINEFPDLDTIFLETEAINLNPSFLEEFTDKLSEFNKKLDRPIAYGANIRLHANMDIPKVVKEFVKANIVVINIGLESGSERVRKEILDRPEYTNDDVRQVVRLAKKYHRHVMLFALLGLPGETLSECRQTMKIVKELRPSFVHLGIFTPYPGTVLYDRCAKEGLIDPSKYKERGRHLASFDTQYMTKRQIEKEYYCFFPRVYAKNKKEYIILRIIFFLVYRMNFTFLAKYGLKYLK